MKKKLAVRKPEGMSLPVDYARLRPTYQYAPKEAKRVLGIFEHSALTKRIADVKERCLWRFGGGKVLAKAVNRPSSSARKMCKETFKSPIPKELMQGIGLEESLQISCDLLMPSPCTGFCLGMSLEFIARVLKADLSKEGIEGVAKFFEEGASADALALQNYYGQLVALYARISDDLKKSYADYIDSLRNQRFDLIESQIFPGSRACVLDALREVFAENATPPQLRLQDKMGRNLSPEVASLSVICEQIYHKQVFPNLPEVIDIVIRGIRSLARLLDLRLAKLVMRSYHVKPYVEELLGLEAGVYLLLLQHHAMAYVKQQGSKKGVLFDPNYGTVMAGKRVMIRAIQGYVLSQAPVYIWKVE